MRRSAAICLALMWAVPSVVAQPAPAVPAAQIFSIPQTGVSFSTGDTWTQNGQQMRLYGVQACLRGTTYTQDNGKKADCGEASLAYFAALVRDTHPRCTPIAQVGTPPSIIVVCSASVGTATLDLGTILLTQGYGFASFTNEGKPVYVPYLVAELHAKKTKSGLWQANDLPHPVPVLLQAAQKHE